MALSFPISAIISSIFPWSLIEAPTAPHAIARRHTIGNSDSPAPSLFYFCGLLPAAAVLAAAVARFSFEREERRILAVSLSVLNRIALHGCGT